MQNPGRFQFTFTCCMQIRAFLVKFSGLAFFRSLSFISATGASSFLLFAVCYLLTDVLGWWNGAPFLHPGITMRNLPKHSFTFFFFCRKSECLGILGLFFIVLPMSVTCIVMLTTAGDGIFKGEIYFYGTVIPSMMELKS